MITSREIKFRGKRLDNGEWVYGDLLHGRGGLMWIVVDAYKTLYEPGSPDSTLAYSNEQNLFRVDPKSVGQFIGLKGKSSVEIYENDILLRDNRKLKIYFDVIEFVFEDLETGERLEWPKYDGRIPPGAWISEGVTVLGDVNDNPELLEGRHE